MAVFSVTLIKTDLSSVHLYSSIHWKSHFLQGTIKTRPCLTGDPVGANHCPGSVMFLFERIDDVDEGNIAKRLVFPSYYLCRVHFFSVADPVLAKSGFKAI